MRILWIPHTGWHIPQRAHIFCRALAKRHEVHVTDWVADFASLPDFLSLRYLKNFSYRYHKDDSIYVHGIPRISPALFSAQLRRFNQQMFSRYVQFIIDKYEIETVVGTFVVPPPRAPRVIFDLFDDNIAFWRRYGRFPAYADEIATVEHAYLASADAVAAASSVLVDLAHSHNPRGPVHWIPNGVDLSQFQNANGQLFREKLGVRGKLVGVVGNHDKPAELDKVLFAARALQHEDVTFLIAGRGTAVSAAKAQVAAENLNNVRFHGFVPMEELAHVMGALDVGLCPYMKSDADDARSPMRLVTYSAQGTPVVCTDLLSVRRLDWPNVVLVDDSPEAMLDGIKIALTLSPQVPADIERFDMRSLVAQYESILTGEAVFV